MVFSSLTFLFRFMPLALLLYYVTPNKLKNSCLLLISLVFYSWGEPVYVLIMLFSTFVDYFNGAMVSKYKQRGDMKKAKFFVLLSVMINLGLLAFFKYIDFILGNINSIFGTAIPVTGLPLPIGISFYTFQTMSYTIDVYRGDATAQKNILNFGAYVTMFPQLVAGPIVQYKTIDEQLAVRPSGRKNNDGAEMTGRVHNTDVFTTGIMRFICGLGKKVLFANNIGMLWDEVSAMSGTQMSVLTAWLGITAFAFQIYFDFSGYSDMAIGLGKMFGFTFNENFNYPYISKSITEFWRRWHISLGTWFREYVYIPLGGNRCSKAKHVRNILIVWALTGIWHGAGWNFALWGLYYGALLLIEKFFLNKILDKLPNWVKHIYVIILTWVGWTIFAFDNIQACFSYLGVMFGINAAGLADSTSLYYISQYAIVLLILAIASTRLPINVVHKISDYASRDNIKVGITMAGQILKGVFIAGVTVLAVAYLVDASYNPFLYFRF